MLTEIRHTQPHMSTHTETAYTPTQSASSHTAGMDVAQERNDVKVVLEAE